MMQRTLVNRMFRRSTRSRLTTTTTRLTECLKLDVPDAAVLLNAIATQYEKLDRMLFEYVDNALDAAAAVNANEESIDRERRTIINVDIDHSRRNVWIRDNGVGFDEEQLMRVVTSVGSSNKRDNPQMNGRFGFGMQCFRGAAESMSVFSRANMSDTFLPDRATQVRESTIALRVERDSAHLPGPFRMSDQKAARLRATLDDAKERGILDSTEGYLLPENSLTGTAVVLENIDSLWWSNLSLSSLAKEIESHFEVLLANRGIEIIVSERGESENATRKKTCKSFDYGKVPGTRIERTIAIGDGEHVRVDLVVGGTTVPGRKVRFFQNGRRVNEVAQIRSFARSSPSKGFLWDHPGVCGFVEIAGTSSALEPVLTRTDFARTRGRERVYRALSEMEDEIEGILNDSLRSQADDSLSELEDVLAGALRGVERDRRRRHRHGRNIVDDSDPIVEVRRETAVVDGVTYESLKSRPKTESSADEIRKRETPGGRSAGFGIQFVRAPSIVASIDSGNDDDSGGGDGSGNDVAVSALRSFRTGSDTFCINVDHPHFTQRLRRDRAGRLLFDARLCAYLATEVATQYHTTQARLQQVEDDNTGGASVSTPSEAELFHALNSSANELEAKLFTKVSGLTRRIRARDRFKNADSQLFENVPIADGASA